MSFNPRQETARKKVRSQDSQQIYVGDRYQQIYSWRGAINAMQELDIKNRCNITQSFRFGQPIADVANNILNHYLSADVEIKGFDKVNSSVERVISPDAILCRTNGALIGHVLGLLGEGESIAVAGGCKDLISLLKGAKDLINGKETLQRELALFKSWSDVVEYSESDTGADLKLLVKLIKEHDVDSLISSLKEVDSNSEKNADIVLSTAHKSKGREWGSVELADDFRTPKSNGFSDEEVNLLYVAATRAKNKLDITNCDAAKIALGLLTVDNKNKREWIDD